MDKWTLQSTLFSSFTKLNKERIHMTSRPAILVFQNSETAAMLVFQTNPVGVGLFSYVENFLLFP